MVGALLPDSMRAEMRGLHQSIRSADDTAEFSNERQKAGVSDGTLRFIYCSGGYLGCLMHDSEYTKVPKQSQAISVPVRFVLAYLRKIIAYWNGCQSTSRSIRLQAVPWGVRRGPLTCRRRNAKRRPGRRRMPGGQQSGRGKTARHE